MAVNYDDERFTEVESQKSEALKDLDKTYDGMVESSQKGYNDQIQASKDWVDKQTEIQNKNTDFAIEEINQQKEQTKKDYLKEQSGAYTDWQKQSNQYGVKAEQQASMGMANSGYSESSQVAMYNAYQARVTAAKEVYSRAVLNYDNKITEAKLQNNALLAEIAFEGLKEQLALGIEAMQYKNSLLIQKASEKRAIDTDYYNRWKDVLSQINTENAQAEQKRQFDAQMAFQREQFDEQMTQINKNSSGSSGAIAGAISSAKTANTSTVEKTSSGKSGVTAGSKTANSGLWRTGNTKDGLKVDTKSLKELGYADKSAAEIDELVRAGVLKEVIDPKLGVLRYEKTNPSGVAQNNINKIIKDTVQSILNIFK